MSPSLRGLVCVVIAILCVGCTMPSRPARIDDDVCRAAIAREEHLQNHLALLINVPPTDPDAVLALDHALRERAILATQVHRSRSDDILLRAALCSIARRNDELLGFLSLDLRAELLRSHRY